MEKPSSKGGILSVLSGFYDPLGLGAPFTLEERQIVKKLRQKKLQYIEKNK